MKSIVLSSSFLILNFLFVFTAMGAKPSVPQSPVITYGLVRDEYGAPMTKASSCVLTMVKDADREGNAFAVAYVGDSGIAGMNYRLSLEIDSSGPVRDYAVTAGTEMFIKAKVGGKDCTLTPSATCTTPAQGSKRRLDFSVGTDADADGMPDDWEEWVLDMAGRDSSAAAIAAFRPGDDADGDGMSNLQEYLAGTDPFISTDLLKVESIELDKGSDRAKLTFLTSVGRKYRVLMTENLRNQEWTPVATTREEGADLVYENYAGNGRRMSVYVDARLASMFFRVAVN